ncbi:hypothetical protein [Cellulomonas soli]|uniref:Uncharacterized protein n=1 Tax=Cellulomonas soli TaxID=931535 RepID=A0A512PGK6_9CELL|nr:hypothetical protein [Cellulomonas soli]NYI58201.1 hypothetical protein [Cellulomonas soli]GEP70334.1 hypothetical protein CSO01_30490 [Cellulomonas soli]
MVYTLSSPSVLAADAACHSQARALVACLTRAFSLTPDACAPAPHDQAATAIAWGMVEFVDMTAPSTARALATVVGGRHLPDAPSLARTRLGSARDVARLVLAETGPWPDAPEVTLPGLGAHAAPAAAAAAAAAAWWSRPELPIEHFRSLTDPWRAMIALDEAEPAPAADVYGERADAVADALAALACPSTDLASLAALRWPFGTWQNAMHAAAWAAFHQDRLHAQMVAVLAATGQVLAANPGAGPVELRSALHAAHALVVGALLGDVLDTEPLQVLRMAEAGL